jgi:hypothetical protein
MGVTCDRIKVSYISIPKCACSSLKIYFHEVASGSAWSTEKRQKGPRTTIHKRYPSIPAQDRDWEAIRDMAKVAVVRGPVERLLSCYQNKVEEDRVLTRPIARIRIWLSGVPAHPSFAEFVEHLDRYRTISPVIRSHTELLSHWLGDDPERFDQIFHIRDLDRLQEWVNAKGGRATRIPWANRSDQRLRRRDLSSDLRSKIRARYAQDYALYGPWLRRRNGKRTVV